MLKVLNKFTKKPVILLAINYLKLPLFKELIFDFFYGSKNQLIMNCEGISTMYSTMDEHSKHWFFPRCRGKKIHEPIITKMLISNLNTTDIFVVSMIKFTDEMVNQ